jgi:hypothetical protein
LYFITTPKDVQQAKNIVIWKMCDIKAIAADWFNFIEILKIQNELIKISIEIPFQATI